MKYSGMTVVILSSIVSIYNMYTLKNIFKEINFFDAAFYIGYIFLE